MEGTQNKKYNNDDLREMLEDLFNSRIIDSTLKEKFIDCLYKFHRIFIDYFYSFFILKFKYLESLEENHN